MDDGDQDGAAKDREDELTGELTAELKERRADFPDRLSSSPTARCPPANRFAFGLREMAPFGCSKSSVGDAVTNGV